MKFIVSEAGRILWAMVTVVGLLTLSIVVVYALSERYLRDVQLPPPFNMPLVVDKATVEHGRHLARTRGCFSCHGQQLQGVDFSEEWQGMGTTVAPNLALFAKQHDPAVLEAAIRHGIGHDSKALWSMPSYNFKHLSDDDTVALIAFLQSAPVIEHELPTPRYSWTLRWTIARGAEPHMADLVAAVPELQLGEGDDPRHVRGEYFAMTSCNECHGFDLRGQWEYGPGTPDLAIVAAYSLENFRRLLHEGIAIGDRGDLEMMSAVARDRFADLPDEEIADLHAFLRTLASVPAPANVPWRPGNLETRAFPQAACSSTNSPCETGAGTASPAASRSSEPEVKQMDTPELTEFAKRYATAWSNQNPEDFGMFYAENGSLRVNDGEPSIGRAAVVDTARAFMTAFPDMVVRLVELRRDGNRVEFHWHWTGTNSGPGGTGSAVDLKGYEVWTFGDDGLIVESLGHYDEAEYQRQLNPVKEDN